MSVKKGTRQKGANQSSRKAISQPKPKATSAATLPPVTLSITITKYDRAIQPCDLENWKHEAEKYARILEHPDCPPAFKTAFESVFIDCLVNEEGGMRMTSTELIRVLYPLTFIRSGDHIPVTADAYRMSLLRLSETLVPHEVREAVASAMRAESEGAK